MFGAIGSGRRESVRDRDLKKKAHAVFGWVAYPKPVTLNNTFDSTQSHFSVNN